MYIMYMLTSARETGSCQVSSFGTTQIILADVLSVIPVQTCVLGAQKNRETVLLSTQDKYLLLRNQVICHLRVLIWRSGYFFSCTFSKKILQWRQRTVEAHCLKFWNLFCKPIPMRRRICISMLCCRLLYWPKTCLEDLCIFRILPTYMHSYLVGLEILLSLPLVPLDSCAYTSEECCIYWLM